jgi:glycosyltransferase involved in cell wall biosynthesis
MSGNQRFSVVIPTFNRQEDTEALVERLSTDLPSNGSILVVDDGSSPPFKPSAATRRNVKVLSHGENQGVAASRNTAIEHCRDEGVGIVIMIDSDCIPADNCLEEHLALHASRPEVTAIGGAIFGIGDGLWARVDGAMSWVHSMPYGTEHEVRPPYHLPTTNFSFKLADISSFDEPFDARLQTGEDAYFVRRLIHAGKIVLFSPLPQIQHRDRTRFMAMLAHHYKWGYHQYYVQLGSDISPRCFRLWYRLPFLAVFVPLMPIFALLGAWLNICPWLRARPSHLAYFPFFYLVWMAKALAVVVAAVKPEIGLRPVRNPSAQKTDDVC